MSEEFLFHYKAFTGQSGLYFASQENPLNAIDFASSLLDEKHLIIMNALLEQVQKETKAEPGVLPLRAKKSLNDLRQLEYDIQRRLIDFQKAWRDRLQYSALMPFLKQGEWVLQEGNTFKLTGNGTKNESRLLYQQSVRDMVTEAARIAALAEGRINIIQNKLSSLWQTEAITDNFSRIAPLLERSVCEKELNIFRTIRTSIQSRATALFISTVNHWDKRVYSSPQDLFNNMAWPWYKPGCNSNGFEGFMELIANFIRAFLKLQLSLYNKKWRLFFRGLSFT